MSGRGQGYSQNPPMGTQGGNGGPRAAQYAQDFYTYVASFGNLAAGAQSIVNLQVQADSDFEWIMSTAYATLNGGTPPFSSTIALPINVTLQDSGSGRNLFSAAMPLSAIAGTGQLPFILPVPRLFKARSNFAITAVNIDGASQYNNIFWTFIGRKIFDLST